MYKCPQNHESDTADFCSVCGAELPAAIAAAAPPASPGDHAGPACPDCGTPSDSPNQVYCEVCGHNFQTGSSGVPPAPSPAPSASAAEAPPVGQGGQVRWEVTLQVDPCLYGTANADAPVGQPPQVFSLFQAENLIGRHAPGVRAHVPVHNDPGVSRRHAVLLLDSVGVISVRDLGSANGTQLNGIDLVPGVAAPLKDGDSIGLGAWTRLLVRAVKTP